MSDPVETPAALPDADALPGAPSGPSEEEAWALVLAGWADAEVHRAYLRRFTDLEGFAVAGGRYRAVLAERPGDAIALRMRDELVKRATVYGLATLPRTSVQVTPPWVKRFRMAAGLVFGSVAVWAIYRLTVLLGARS